jgi:hypothetical protein
MDKIVHFPNKQKTKNQIYSQKDKIMTACLFDVQITWHLL